MIFVCPKCKGKLNIDEDSKAAKCALGHSYDKSRFGYYNLLLGASSGTHGDNKEMVLARREFLSRGFYLPLASRVGELCEGVLSNKGIILDAGCGEGYYTSIIREKCKSKFSKIAVFDISKDAVREAAKKKCADEYAVASAYHMPTEDESVDLIVNTFSPLAKDEVYRSLKKGAYFIMAIPAEEHLYGLKAAIYDTPYKNEVADTSLEGFTLVAKEELKYPIYLNTESDIRALFMMTPYAYRTSALGRERVLSLKELKTDAHFLILTYRKDF
ncbi:MAG: methyltransferase domain-containing protein [Ruminococcaceae bacterium]|nr:methyltransferase domain-containing protein [Oscillospiraceae bacterium]